jgi:ABC-type transporter Mla MlaB component
MERLAARESQASPDQISVFEQSLDPLSGNPVAAAQLQPGHAARVVLQGEIAISSATELKSKLGKALEEDKDIVVTLADVTALDITAIQLLWAAVRQAKMTGRRFTFDEPIPLAILETMALVGIPSASLFGGRS